MWSWRPDHREGGWQAKESIACWGDSETPHPLGTLKGISSRDWKYRSPVISQFLQPDCLPHLHWYLWLQGSTHRLWKGGRWPLSLFCPTQCSAYKVIAPSPSFSNLVSRHPSLSSANKKPPNLYPPFLEHIRKFANNKYFIMSQIVFFSTPHKQ